MSPSLCIALNAWVSIQVTFINIPANSSNTDLVLDALSMQNLFSGSQEEGLILHAFWAPVPN